MADDDPRARMARATKVAAKRVPAKVVEMPEADVAAKPTPASVPPPPPPPTPKTAGRTADYLGL